VVQIHPRNHPNSPVYGNPYYRCQRINAEQVPRTLGNVVPPFPVLRWKHPNRAHMAAHFHLGCWRLLTEEAMEILNAVFDQPTPLKVHATNFGSSLSIGATLAGQSGSPIVDAKGRAVALVSVVSGPQPILKFQLPRWLLKTAKGMAHR